MRQLGFSMRLARLLESSRMFALAMVLRGSTVSLSGALVVLSRAGMAFFRHGRLLPVVD